MRELQSPSQVATATDDLLVRWAAQALSPGYPLQRGRAWLLDDAVAVHTPGLNRENHLFFTGSPDAAAKLLTEVLPRREEPPGPSPVGPVELARAVAERIEWEIDGRFGWMELGTLRTGPSYGVDWLPDSAAEDVAALLHKANPHSYLFPDDPGARRWAGVHDATGQLVAVAGDAWPAPDVGFLGGVATHPDHRNRGYSRAVCAFVAERLSREHPAVALMVDRDNAPAIHVYRELGFRYRALATMAPSGSAG